MQEDVSITFEGLARNTGWGWGGLARTSVGGSYPPPTQIDYAGVFPLFSSVPTFEPTSLSTLLRPAATIAASSSSVMSTALRNSCACPVLNWAGLP